MKNHPSPSPLAPLRGKFPSWEAWQGVTGLLYARRRKTSPPPVLHGRTAAELARKIEAWEEGAR
jgi:hypothetical protein